MANLSQIRPEVPGARPGAGQAIQGDGLVDRSTQCQDVLTTRDDGRMATGYGGTYRGIVVDDADPLQQSRLGVVVPEIYGDASVWATALLLAGSAAPLPAIGEHVLVSFERGDTDYPIWEQDSGGQESDSLTRGYIGKYRGVVVGNDDPMQEGRLEVTVPEVDPSPAWAVASDDVRYIESPEIGSDVWIEYEYGDPAYPRWVGLA